MSNYIKALLEQFNIRVDPSLSRMSKMISTQDEKAEKQKKRSTLRLTEEEQQGLNVRIDRAARNVRNADIFAVYSALKGTTNFVERLANQHGLKTTNLGEYDKLTGIVQIVKEEHKKKWGTPRPKKNKEKK